MPRGYTLTLPDEEEIYGVKKEQLNELMTGGKSWSLEVALLCSGAALGYVPSIFESAKKLTSDPQQQLSIWEIMFFGIFILLIGLAIAKFIEHYNKKTSLDGLKEKIVAGQKMTIRSVQD